MPPSKDNNTKHQFGRSLSSNSSTMSARVYHPATNLMPPTPPLSPTGVAPPFPPRGNAYSRQNSHTGWKS